MPGTVHVEFTSDEPTLRGCAGGPGNVTQPADVALAHPAAPAIVQLQIFTVCWGRLVVSDTHVDPALSPPRTQEWRLAAAVRPGQTTTAEITAYYRRQSGALWTPLTGLTRADYAVAGALSGQLFGESYSVAYYAPGARAGSCIAGNGATSARPSGWRAWSNGCVR